MKSGGVRFLAIGVEDAFDCRRRIEAGADLYSASGGAPRGFCTDYGGPSRRGGLLQWPRQQAQVGKREVLSAVGNDAIGERRIDDGDTSTLRSRALTVPYSSLWR
jgi:hypothetical protein